MKKNLFLVISIICLTLTSDLAFAAFSVTLSPSSHNGYSISCFGGRDGAINITVTGGASPFTYRWSTGATSQNVSMLAAGYYEVIVTDANLATCSGNITLTEPIVLTQRLTPSLYIGENNISLYGACNGYINTTITGGVIPYTYLWTTGQTTANVSNLCASLYGVTVTDANGCSVFGSQSMTQPDKASWDLSGTINSNPPSQFIGTIDNKDLVFKTNSSEAFRITANGDLKINSFAGGTGSKLLLSDNLGNISSTKIIIPNQSCFTAPPVLAWTEGDVPSSEIGNCYYRVGIGTTNPQSWLEVAGAIRASANGTSHILDYINIQHDGGTASITNHGSGTLDINCGIGKDVKICSGSGSGNVEMGGNVYMSGGSNDQVGIGTSNPLIGYKLDVDGDAKFNQVKISNFSNADPQNEILAIDQNGILAHTNLNTSILGLWQHSPNPDDVFTTNGSTSVHIRNDAVDKSRIWAVNSGFAYGFGIENDGSNKGHIYKNINSPESMMTFKDNNSKNYVGVNTDNPQSLFQVGNGMTSIGFGPTHDAGANMDWATCYIGFNAYRDQLTPYGWTISSNGYNNGGSALWSNVNGDINFSIKPNTATNSDDPQNTDDAGMKSATRLKIFDADGNTNVHIKNSATNKSSTLWTINGNMAYGFGTETVNGEAFGRIYKDVNTPSAIMSFTGDGNVGIGINNPNERLQVNGGNLMVKGTDNFMNNDNEAAIYLGTSNYCIKSIKGQAGGLSLRPNDNSSLLFLGENGNVGIGTTNPLENVNYPTFYNSNLVLQLYEHNPIIRLSDQSSGADLEIISAWNTARLVSNGNISLFLDADDALTDEAFRIFSNSDDGPSGDLLFYVNNDGRAFAKSFKVKADLPDYVFDTNYKLKSLKEVECFIKANHHLEGVVSAKEALENDLDLGELVTKQLEKIEELTLYAIDQNKAIEQLQKENEEIKKALQSLGAQLKKGK